MNSNLHKNLIKVSKICIYGIIAQLSFYTFASALGVRAQSVDEVRIDFEVQISTDLDDLLKKIEKSTEFRFSYIDGKFDDRQIRLNSQIDNLGDLLRAVSKQAGVSFKRVDETIYIKRTEKKDKPIVEIIQHEVRGTVTDENENPLPGATVLEKGTSNGTITDVEGNFKLSVGGPNSTLLISFVGYKNTEYPLNGQSGVQVSLSPDYTSLEEVIVVGYGEQKKETLTGSVSRVDGEDIAINPSPNVATSLSGRLPGLIVNQRSGWPGREDLSILVRGTGTLGDNTPLIVIDGVPRDNLGRLNPEDIESISVLKDGSAAIYGARGANGVILVTTKKGSKGAPKFNLSYNYAVHQPTKIPDMMDAVMFAESYNEAEWYRQGRPDMSDFVPFFSDDAIQKYRDGSDPVLFPNTDWPDEVTKDYSFQQRINLQASGGSEKTRYLLSFGLIDQDGNFKNNPTHYRQYNARINVDADLIEGLTVGANINAIFNDRTYAAQAVDFVGLLQSNPTLPAIYPNGLIAPGRFNNNPLLIDRSGSDKIKDYPLYTTFTVKYEVPFIQGLTVDASYNYDLRNEFQKWFRTPYHYHEYNVQTREYDLRVTPHPIELRDTYRQWTTSLSNFRVSYQMNIAQHHHLLAMIGTEQQKQTFSYAEAYRKNFVSSAIPQINAGSTDPDDRSNGGSLSKNAYNNYLGRVNYDFKTKYLFEFVFRYDGSPIFREGNRYGFFPAVSAGWRLSEESFMSSLPFISELKLRGSYGELGNDRVGVWQYLQAFEFGDNYVFGGTDVPGIYPGRLPNPAITWEVANKYDVGLTAELWEGRLGVDLTLFKQKRSNILWARNLSIGKVFGFPALPDENIGKVENHGFELVVSHRKAIGDLVYSVSANTTFARSKIIFIDEVPPAEPYQAATGHPIGSGLYYKSDGIFNTQEELDSYPHGNGAQAGDIKVIDLNDDGVINGDDRYRADFSAVPEYIFGLTGFLQYKGIDLTLFFQGQTNVYSNDFTLTEFGQQDLDNNTVYRAKDRWTVNNQEGATMPRADSWQPGATDFFFYDATFIRLKNLELGYSFRNQLKKVNPLKDVRLFVSGTNLLTWSKEITWRDPELDGDFTEYPPVRIINFGVDVKF